ncbi:MAG: acetyl-CoA C-acyltransferase [Candidatus Dormibacteria bacterium]
MPEPVVVACGRSPIGRAFKGSLVDWRPDDLAALVVERVLERVPALDRSAVDDLICGCGLPGGEQGFNLGRIVSVLTRLDCPGTTITRYCASSLQSTRMAAHAIRAGEGDVFLSVGVESVTRYQNGTSDMPQCRNPRLEPGNPDGYPDVYIQMGETAEIVAEREQVSREEMDRFALRSQERAVAAQDTGFSAREIVPVPLAGGMAMTADDGPRRDTSLERLATLEPAFRAGGRVTAGNSCPLNDGAAAVVVMSDSRARELEIPALARIVSTGLSALEPERMGLGPIEASRQALARAGMTVHDVDLIEINEAFAAQVIPSARGLGLDPFDDRLNPHGGAIALGHPFGMTGVRILCTLLNGLEATGGQIGLETMCVGGGMGMAMIVERLG